MSDCPSDCLNIVRRFSNWSQKEIIFFHSCRSTFSLTYKLSISMLTVSVFTFSILADFTSTETISMLKVPQSLLVALQPYS